MTDANASLAESYEVTAYDEPDGAPGTDITTCCLDTDTSTACGSGLKIGKNNDVLRIEFAEDLADLVAGDAVTAYITNNHAVGTFTLIPYSGAGTVDIANEVTVNGGGPTGAVVFTLTSGFIGALFDQGSGTWACRLTEDNGLSGDYMIAEIEADLTVGGAPSATYPGYYGQKGGWN